MKRGFRFNGIRTGYLPLHRPTRNKSAPKSTHSGKGANRCYEDEKALLWFATNVFNYHACAEAFRRGFLTLKIKETFPN